MGLPYEPEVLPMGNVLTQEVLMVTNHAALSRVSTFFFTYSGSSNPIASDSTSLLATFSPNTGTNLRNVLKKKIKEQHLGITAGGDSRSMLSLALDCESLCTSDEQLTSHPETYNNSMSFWGDTPIITVTEDSVFSDPLEQKKLSLEGEQVSLCQIKVEMKATKDKEMGPEFALKVHHEHEDEVMGTIRSANDALDPLEKEWIYSAACGRLPVLSHLLEQEPNLVHKKTGLHWAAKHGKEDMAILLANAGVDVNTRAPPHTTSLLDPSDLDFANGNWQPSKATQYKCHQSAWLEGSGVDRFVSTNEVLSAQEAYQIIKTKVCSLKPQGRP
ncbi:SWAHC protein, partial [Polypterus senegalus]